MITSTPMVRRRSCRSAPQSTNGTPESAGGGKRSVSCTSTSIHDAAQPVVEQRGHVVRAVEPARLAALVRDVADVDALRGRGADRVGTPPTRKFGMRLVYRHPGPMTMTSRPARSPRAPAGRPAGPPVRGARTRADVGLTARCRLARAAAGRRPRHASSTSSSVEGRQAPRAPSIAAARSMAAGNEPSDVGERGDDQIAERVSREPLAFREAVLEQRRASSESVVAERHEAVADISGRQHPECGAASRTTRRRPPSSRSRSSRTQSSSARRTRGRPVPPPIATTRGPVTDAHPTGVRVAADVAVAHTHEVALLSRGTSAVSSARTTLRCMPPVQPSATARWLLPSSW